MKNILKLIGTIALVAVIGFSMACGDDDGGITTIPVTGVTLNKSSISLKVGDTETLTATVAPNNATNKAVTWSSSDATKATVSEGVVTAVAAGTATITVTTADGSKTAQCTVTVTSVGDDDVLPEDKPVKDRWGKWISDTSTATLNYSVDDDGVCTITVGGTAEPRWNRYKINAQYAYTATAGASYVYKFEAWTESGTRDLNFQYNTDNDEKIYLWETISITSTRKTYTIYGGELSNGTLNQVEFHCADQLGTFYVKILEIKEYTPQIYTFTSITDFSNWLSSASPNTPATSHKVKLNVSDLGGSSDTSGSVGNALKDNSISLDLSGSTITSIKYISLDLSESTITSIGERAFDGCYMLTSVTIPNSVTIIGNYAFHACSGLTSVTIPNSVTSIGDGIFATCTRLTAINVDTANTAYISQDSVLYNKAKTTLIQYPAGKINSSFSIPNSVTSIGNSAFEDCHNLTSVTIPNSVTIIGDDAFCQAGLTSVTIGSSVTSIGSGAFHSTYLTSIIIPSSVTSIGTVAFAKCSDLTSVTFQGTIPSSGFDTYEVFGGNLRATFYAIDSTNGTPGTYTRSANGTWTKQPS